MALSYLPNINSEELNNIFALRQWDSLKDLLDKQNYDRLGFDRLFIILSDLYSRFGSSSLKILDVGCNNGLFSFGLAAMGHDVTGIDSGIIDTQKRYDKMKFLSIPSKKLNLSFVDSKVEDYLKKKDQIFDCVLLLSVLHQFENGYAFDEASKYSEEQVSRITNDLFSRAKQIVYYECPYDEPSFEYQYGYHFLTRYLKRRESFCIEEIAKTVGPSGVIRQLFAIMPRYL